MIDLLRRDHFLTGLIVGTIVPITAYGIILFLYDTIDQSNLISESLNFRQRSMALFALCFNLLPFHYYKKIQADNAMRGMIIPTMGYVIIWFFMFGRHMLNLV